MNAKQPFFLAILTAWYLMVWCLPLAVLAETGTETNTGIEWLEAQWLEEWRERRPQILELWTRALGQPKDADFPAEVVSVGTFETPDFRAEVLRQATGPQTQQRMVLLKPLRIAPDRNRTPNPRVPGIVVPYYDPDRMCGYDLTTHERIPAYEKTSCFGLQLVRQGYVVLCVEAYPFNLLPDFEREDFAIWQAAAEELHRREPGWTGMGKLTADVRLAIDLLARVPEVDPERLAIAGHSLGGKMSFYAGCLDPRVKAIVASDFGFRWEDSNWTAPWYWDAENVHLFQKTGQDHRSLLALHAPHLFILIAGEADGEQTVPFLEQTGRIFGLFTDQPRIHILNHHTGHQPTWPALRSAWSLLAEEFGWSVPESLTNDRIFPKE